VIRDGFIRKPERNGNLQKFNLIAGIFNRGLEAESKDVANYL